VIMKVFYLNKH